ncbi:MFS transporter [Paenibacillus sp. OK003]|uniref:MFS transporter n=1 Tax=Paenibacillus sp. OK003 TaxID=1884380 RepID=UPI0008C62680|nr:MFS transporter [Paenibacillus sp. OK003]SEK61436.1 Fucose permease [Paenibacillus sp. OK003]
MKYPHLKMGLGIYLSYLLLGMVNIMLASNMNFLSERLHVAKTDISLLISVVGVGHLLTINIAGKLSDRYGRKPLIIAATLLYAVLLVGTPLTTHFQIALLFAFLAGISNSLLDSGSYPALNESYQEAAGTAIVLIKAFMSVGAIILPALITFLMSKELFFGYAFFIPAILFAFLGMYFVTIRFPGMIAQNPHKERNEKHSSEQRADLYSWKEGSALVIIGFFSVSLSTVIQTWLPTYGNQVLQLNEKNAVELLSFYSMGGLICILVLAFLLKKFIKPITAMVVTPGIATVFLVVLLAFRNPVLAPFIAFFLGLFTSGMYQLAMTVMIDLFPARKGVSVSYVSASASVAFMVIPFITSLLVKHIGVSAVFYFDLCIAVMSTCLALYLSKQMRSFSK